MIFPFKLLALHKMHYLKQQKIVFKSRGVVPFYRNWLRLRKGFRRSEGFINQAV
jgi:hypothetical protein